MSVEGKGQVSLMVEGEHENISLYFLNLNRTRRSLDFKDNLQDNLSIEIPVEKYFTDEHKVLGICVTLG